MAPTPISVNGILRLTLTISDQERHIDFYCQRSGVTPTTILSYAGSGFAASGDVVGQVIWDLLKAFYPATVAAPSWTLFDYDDGAYIPLSGGSLTGVGESATAVKLATQATLTFRSGNQVLTRLQLPEPAGFSLPINAPLATEAGADIVALRDSYTDNPDGTNVSSWISARDGSIVFRAISVSNDTNDRYRRARGL